MSKRTRGILIAISFLIGLMGLISMFFSIWSTARAAGASFWLTGVWFPVGVFALFVGLMLGLSAACSPTKE